MLQQFVSIEQPWEQNGATPPEKTVIRRRNRTKFGHGHHLAVGFSKNLALFEVPNSLDNQRKCNLFANRRPIQGNMHMIVVDAVIADLCITPVT